MNEAAKFNGFISSMQFEPSPRQKL